MIYWSYILLIAVTNLVFWNGQFLADTNFSHFIFTIIRKSVKNNMMMTMIMTDNTSSFIEKNLLVVIV